METGIELIAKERQEQIEKHGRTIEKDVLQNKNEELRKGAEALIREDFKQFPIIWDEEICEKMFRKQYKERLIIAGAFIAAEIDRLEFLEYRGDPNAKP